MRVARTLTWAFISSVLIVSFVFSVLSLTSSHWATSDQYVQIPVTSTSSNAGQYVYAATSFRGPYHAVNYTFTTDPSTGATTNSSSINKGRICTVSPYPFGDFPWFCQQLKIGVKTLIAGSAFTGIAMVFALLATVASLAASRAGVIDIVFQRLVLLCGVLGALGEGIGGLIVANTLVNQQVPDGDFISDAPLDPSVAHWVIGKGVKLVAIACLPTVIALTFLPSASTAVGKHHNEHGPHHDHRNGEDRHRRYWQRRNEEMQNS